MSDKLPPVGWWLRFHPLGDPKVSVPALICGHDESNGTVHLISFHCPGTTQSYHEPMVQRPDTIIYRTPAELVSGLPGATPYPDEEAAWQKDKVKGQRIYSVGIGKKAAAAASA